MSQYSQAQPANKIPPQSPPQASKPSSDKPPKQESQLSPSKNPASDQAVKFDHLPNPSDRDAKETPSDPEARPNGAEDATGQKEPSAADDGEYPEQLHAGKVGLGPEYGKGTGLFEKLTGVKEELRGKITRDEELAQKGHDRRTGELQKKEKEEDEKNSPFQSAGKEI